MRRRSKRSSSLLFSCTTSRRTSVRPSLRTSLALLTPRSRHSSRSHSCRNPRRDLQAPLVGTGGHAASLPRRDARTEELGQDRVIVGEREDGAELLREVVQACGAESGCVLSLGRSAED